MKRFLCAVGVVLVAMLFLEIIWFSLAIERLYRPELGTLLADDVRILPALLFYALYPIAVVILAVRPFDALTDAFVSFGRGLVLGLAAYGAYELTNLATLSGWSELVTIVDLGWGCVLTSVSAFLGTAITNRIFGNTVS